MSESEELKRQVAELADRVAVLERRTAGASRAGAGGGAASVPAQGEPGAGEEATAALGARFWALAGIKEEVARHALPGGEVMIVGSVETPGGGPAEWQEGIAAGELLDQDWAELADAVAALGNPVRLRLLRALLAGRSTAAELVELDGVGTTGQVYHHLRQLTAAGWLRTSGRGRYEVPTVRIVPLLALLLAARR